MTSNLGSDIILDGIGADGEISEEAKAKVSALLKSSFRPEFLNRLDEIVFYKPLTKANIIGIIDLLIKDLNKRLAENQLSVVVSDDAKAYIVDHGFDPVYGARPLKRYLQSNVETLLARKIIGENVAPGTVLHIDLRDGELVCNY